MGQSIPSKKKSRFQQICKKKFKALNLNFQVGTKKYAAAEKGKANQKTIKAEVLPSPHGTRIAPKIPEELRKKAAQAIAAKDRKEGKVMLNILTR